MKILFITDLYPVSTSEESTPLTLHNFVFEWTKQGHNIDVIKPNFVFNSFLRKKPFYKTSFYEYEGIKIFNVNYFTPFLFDITKKISNTINVSDYDIIIAHMPSGIIFANKLAKKFHKPLICGVHYSDLEVLTNPIYKLYFKSQLKDAYKNSQKIACRSFVLQKKFNKILPAFLEKTFVAMSGVNVDKSGIAEPFTTHHSPFTILTCASLIKRKNIDKLILAINDLEDFKLNIIGDGPELKYLKKISSNKINFLGRLPNKEVLEEMKKTNIFILPSIKETFGMVYLEAMSSGCITVCTKNEGIDGIIINEENGFLCEPTIDGIKEVLLKIKKQDNLEKISENSLNTINKYSASLCAQNYIKNI